MAHARLPRSLDFSWRPDIMPVQVLDPHKNIIAEFLDISTLSVLAEEVRWLRHAPILRS
jgi:hypothetical protein